MCIDLHQTGFVGKGSDYLQLIKFWPSRAPGKGSTAGENFWFRLTTASAQCLGLSERFFHQCSDRVSPSDIICLVKIIWRTRKTLPSEAGCHFVVVVHWQTRQRRSLRLRCQRDGLRWFETESWFRDTSVDPKRCSRVDANAGHGCRFLCAWCGLENPRIQMIINQHKRAGLQEQSSRTLLRNHGSIMAHRDSKFQKKQI